MNESGWSSLLNELLAVILSSRILLIELEVSSGLIDVYLNSDLDVADVSIYFFSIRKIKERCLQDETLVNCPFVIDCVTSV